MAAGDRLFEPFDKDGKVAEFLLKLGEEAFGVGGLGKLLFEASKLGGLIQGPGPFEQGLGISDLFEPLFPRRQAFQENAMGIHNHVGQHVDSKLLAEGVDLSPEKLDQDLSGNEDLEFVFDELSEGSGIESLVLLLDEETNFLLLRPGGWLSLAGWPAGGAPRSRLKTGVAQELIVSPDDAEVAL